MKFFKLKQYNKLLIFKEHFATFNKSSTSNPNANSVSYASSNEDGNVENKDTIESVYRTNIESSSYNYSSNVSNSISSTMINKYKMLDHIYLPFTNALVPRDEILNSISYCNLSLSLLVCIEFIL